jgi:hypothetical protein
MKRLLIGLASMVALTGCGGAVVAESHQPHEREHQLGQPSLAMNPAPAPAPAPEPTVPTRLRLDGIDAPVVPLHLTGSELVPPADPTVVGWWGRKAGARHGVTLLTGHTVHDGGGDLDDLEDVQVGSTATVSGIEYDVTSLQVISKNTLARQAPRLFDQSGEHRLVVVTCEGYDPATGHYDSNVVLTAEPV